jgi:diguanylate cyclase (GGDEF)-like protein
MGLPSDAFAAKRKKLRDTYVQQLPEQVANLQAALKELGEHPESMANLFRLFHNLKGASASFGLREMSAVAGEGEHLAHAAMDSSQFPDTGWHRQIQEILHTLLEAVGRIDETPAPVGVAPEPPRLDSVQPAGGSKLIYLCDDDQFQRESLASQVRCFGFEVMTFEDLEPLREAIRSLAPDAIVMDVMLPGRPQGGPGMMKIIQGERQVPLPTVFISANGDLPFRLSAVGAGSCADLVKPVNINDLCTTLAALTSALKPEPFRVLIVDDEPQLAEYHALILQEAGMTTAIVTDPLQVMGPLTDLKPDLILMDMYMPGCNGLDLAKAIRQIATFFSIPIIFLSTETDQDKQFSAIAHGGDAFLTKPIKSHHLISAVAIRAERMKILRSFMVRDSMTGLFNHTTTKEHLETAINQANRTHSELCFAMIDVDQFKLVNDTYGHATGDLVLITLSRLLQQRLRETDIIGRFGGEEFAVVLPDCNLPEAVNILENLREGYATIRFDSPAGGFYSSFSCGISTLSRCGAAAELCKAADEAMYAAKQQGRNRLVIAGRSGQIQPAVP